MLSFKSIRKSKLSLALSAAVLAGGMMASPVQAVQLAQDGLGDAVIFPYFTANGDWQTFIRLINTSSTNSVVVKVRYREAANSRELRDFLVALSPNDMWSAWTDDTAYNNQPGIRTNDTSCIFDLPNTGVDTFNTISGNLKGVPFSTFAFTGSSGADYSDGSPASTAARLREGYIEIIGVSSYGPNDPFTRAVTHNQGTGFPENCTEGMNLFRTGTTLPQQLLGAVPTPGAAFALDVGNVIAANAQLINVPNGEGAGYDPIILSNFKNTPLHTETLLNLNAGNAGHGSWPTLDSADPHSLMLTDNGNFISSVWDVDQNGRSAFGSNDVAAQQLLANGALSTAVVNAGDLDGSGAINAATSVTVQDALGTVIGTITEGNIPAAVLAQITATNRLRVVSFASPGNSAVVQIVPASTALTSATNAATANAAATNAALVAAAGTAATNATNTANATVTATAAAVAGTGTAAAASAAATAAATNAANVVAAVAAVAADPLTAANDAANAAAAAAAAATAATAAAAAATAAAAAPANAALAAAADAAATAAATAATAAATAVAALVPATPGSLVFVFSPTTANVTATPATPTRLTNIPHETNGNATNDRAVRGGIDAVSALLSRRSVINEWAASPNPTGIITDFYTQWVVTFPTKHYYVDLQDDPDTNDRFAPTLSDPRGDAGTDINDAFAPFSMEFNTANGTGNTAGLSCESYDMQLWDREESQLGFSSPADYNPSRICNEVNVLSFTTPYSTRGLNSAFGAVVPQTLLPPNAMASTFTRATRGWARMTFNGAGSNTGLTAVSDITGFGANISAPVSTLDQLVRYQGLPVAGFMFSSYNTGSAARNHNSINVHKHERDIETVGGAANFAGVNGSNATKGNGIPR